MRRAKIHVRRNWVLTLGFRTQPLETHVNVRLDAGGRVRARTRIFDRDLLVADVPRRPAPLGGSFYARHGDVFAGGCWLGVAGLAVAARRRGRNDGKQRRST